MSQYLEADEYLTEIDIVIKGTGSGAPGFHMLDFRVLGTVIDNPTDTVYVSGSNAVTKKQAQSQVWPFPLLLFCNERARGKVPYGEG